MFYWYSDFSQNAHDNSMSSALAVVFQNSGVQVASAVCNILGIALTLHNQLSYAVLNTASLTVIYKQWLQNESLTHSTHNRFGRADKVWKIVNSKLLPPVIREQYQFKIDWINFDSQSEKELYRQCALKILICFRCLATGSVTCNSTNQEGPTMQKKQEKIME